VPIIFTNVSGVACTLYGYPGVSLAGGSPLSQIGLAATENSATSLQLVTLGPGEQASALLRIVSAQNYPPGRCGLVHTTYLQVYPPRQTAPIYVAYSSAACKKPIHLLSVERGQAGLGRLRPNLLEPGSELMIWWVGVVWSVSDRPRAALVVRRMRGQGSASFSALATWS